MPSCRLAKLVVSHIAVSLIAATAQAQASARGPAPESPAPPAASASGDSLVIPLRGHGSLVLDVPEGWRYEVVQAEGEIPPTISLEPRAGLHGGAIQITPLWSPDERDVSSPAALRDFAELFARRLDAPLESLKPLAGARGWFLTRRDPEVSKDPDDYPYMTSVTTAVDQIQIHATILAGTEDSPARKAGFGVLRTLEFLPEEAPAIPVALTSPDGKWDLRIDLPKSFAVAPRQDNDKGDGVAVEARDAAGWTLTAFIEKNPRGGTATLHRGMVIKGAREGVRALAKQQEGHDVKLVDLRTWEDGGRAMFSHGATFDGQPILKSRNMIFVHEGYWIDVHLSRSPPGVDDAAAFEAIASRIRVE